MRISSYASLINALAISTALSLTALPAYAGFKVDQTHALPKTKIKENPKLSSTEPVLLTADQIDYDQPNNVVYAEGHVEVIQGESIVLADTLIYDQAHDQVQAQGHVVMLESTGNVYFADNVDFESELKTGVVKQFKGRLADDSVVVASSAHKISDSVTQLFNVAYTPCKCQDDKGNPKSPFWSITADKATIDQDKKEMVYDNAFFNLGDTVPIAYTPYLSHPTPGADNQSGLLAPSFLRSRSLGLEYRQPVYYTIAPDRDITLTPVYTSNAGPVMMADYRQMFDAGPIDIKGSLTNAPNRDALGDHIAGHELRGSIDANGRFQINDKYDWGFNISRATDDTYLRLYNFSNETLLNSRVYAEGHNIINNSNRSYVSVEALSFQGLTGQDNSKVIPVVAPLVNFNWQSDPGDYNSRLSVDANSMALFRQTGDESRRLSGTLRWDLPYITDDGQMIQFESQMRTDIYDVSNVQLEAGKSFNGVTGRAVPQASVLWRYPFVNRFDGNSLVLEPIVNAVASPNGGNPAKIPNEDSLLPDFTDANLFDNNRFAGFDRIETGPRVSYGVRSQALLNANEYIDGLFGQQYRVNNDPNFPITKDLNSHTSDYVGRVGMTYQPFSLGYRFRLDKEDLYLTRSEIDAGYNLNPVNVSISYLSLQKDPVLTSREVVTGSGSLNLDENWSVNASTSRDLRLDQTVTATTGVSYKNECVNLTAMVGKDYTNLLDIKPSLNFWFRVSLKNLD